MPRRTSSSWDFGELFPPQATRKVWSVTEVTARIRGLLEKEIGEAWIAGEVTNCRAQASGHLYFTLKDTAAQISCVLFRGTQTTGRGVLQDGQRVIVQGDLTVYEPRGQYQLIVRHAEGQGQGALQAAFERLKQKLQAEGLFDPARKRPIPRFPHRVGIATSPTGAALQDVLHVMRRRFAGLELVLAPCRVQGAGAAAEIASAIAQLNRWKDPRTGRGLEVILVTRGGGSLEDLWAFNEEPVARAIAASRIPVVSGVGHEIDITIADLAADLRAATPSAAAELLTAAYVDARDIVARLATRLRRCGQAAATRARVRLDGWAGRLARAHPRRRLDWQAARLEDVGARLRATVERWMERLRERLEAAEARWRRCRPERQLARHREVLAELEQRLRGAAEEGRRTAVERLERQALRLELLSPVKVLARGYSITRDAATGAVLRSADEVQPGQVLRTRLHSGEVTSVAAPDAPPVKAGRRRAPKA